MSSSGAQTPGGFGERITSENLFSSILNISGTDPNVISMGKGYKEEAIYA